MGDSSLFIAQMHKSFMPVFIGFIEASNRSRLSGYDNGISSPVRLGVIEYQKVVCRVARTSHMRDAVSLKVYIKEWRAFPRLFKLSHRFVMDDNSTSPRESHNHSLLVR